MSFDPKQKRIALSIRGGVAAGAVAASLAVAVAVPAVATVSDSGIEFDIEGASVVGGAIFVPSRDSYTARVTVPSDLAFIADKSTVYARGVDTVAADVWEDKTPGNAKPGDPRVYETMLSPDEVQVGAEASIVVSKGGVERSAEVIELSAAKVDSAAPAVSTEDAGGSVVDGDSFKVDASRPQTTIEFNESTSQGYFNTSVDVKITVRPCDNYDGFQIKVNGAVQDDWKKTSLADGSHVFEKTFDDEGSYRICVCNNKTWGKVPGADPERDLVIDRTSPQVNVVWSEGKASHGRYYAEKRIATVIVTDENFDADTSRITAAGGTVGAWSVDGSDPAKHTATVVFGTDGSCDLKVLAADLAGNKAATYESDSFIVDRAAPRIYVSWDNDDAHNGAYYSAPRTATITVNEANYGQSLVEVEGGIVSWDADNPRKGTLTFDSDGTYELKVSATDLAGNVAKPYDSGEFVVDRTAPVIGVEWDNVDAKGAKDGKTYYDAARVAVITLDEKNYDRRLVSIDAAGAAFVAWDADDPRKCTVTFDADGECRLQVDATDLAGNEAGRVDSGAFVVDTKAPQATVTYDLNDPLNGSYFGTERTATIEVEEINFDKDLMSIAVEGDEGSCEVSDWVGKGPKHIATVKFKNSDKALGLKVEGADLARRAVEFGKGEDGAVSTSYDSGEFYVDTVAPVASISRDKVPTNNYQGVDYYNDTVTATVTVADDHFDAAKSSLAVAGSQSESGWVQSAADAHVWTKTVVYAEGTDKSLSVDVCDLAGNVPDDSASALAYGPFTVDMTAPEVTSACVSTPPVNNYSTSYYFYDRAASATIQFADNISLGAISVVDAGDGYYSQDVLVAADAVIGNASATATLAFADGHELDRDVVVKTSDLARNERYWSISPAGKARVLTEQEVENLSVFSPDKVYPEGLLKDTVAPQLSLFGVTEGQYYNEPQIVSLTVDELNFPYLQSYEPDQAVFTVTKQEGNAGRSQSSWSRPVSYLGVFAQEGLSFTDDHGKTYTYDQFGMSETFSEDGHYVIDAQVTDPAKNQRTAHLAEFTVDRTAPTVQVEFDNNDVRNGKYYKAARTATITVTEHNFDASLINIETTGAVGGWSDDGDVHTATVTFATDGVHNLAVSGKDEAGNEMAPYKADEFVVDLTAPTVTITGVEDTHAYKDEVIPVISFADEANFDPSGTTYTLTGTKNGEVFYDVAVAEDGLGSTVTYANFANEPAVDDIYTLTAHLRDLAGNEAEAKLTFSVNRFGSTFRVVDADSYKRNNGYLASSRDVAVEEINVCGVDSEKHGVTVTRGVTTTELTRFEEVASTGYTIDAGISEADDSRGWAVYRYNIVAGNFASDGRYHVSVHSNDLAENINTSSGYFNRESGAESAAEVDFILDTTDPVITNLSVHDGDVIDSEEYEGTFKVVENIGIAEVKVIVDGQEAVARGDAYGNYSFRVKKAAFTDRDLRIVATDLAGRTAEAEARGFHVTTDILELHLAWVVGGLVAAVAAIGGIILVLVKRKKEDGGRGLHG